MVEALPFFSVIIPTYKRPQQLAICLEALTRVTYPHDRFEVIVVDDGSELLPEDAVIPYRDRLDITLVSQRHAGPAAARNRGAQLARGRFLAFTDDDCSPDADWLSVFSSHVVAERDRLIGGQTHNLIADNPYATASQSLVAYLYSYYNSDPDRARFFTSNNIAVAADHYQSIGGFDTTYTLSASEDREFCDRWLHHGYRMRYAPTAQVYHAHDLTFRAYWQQHFTYGRGAAQFHAARARYSRQGIKLESLSFYRNLLWHPFAQRMGRQAPFLTALLLVSQAAGALGYFAERNRKCHDLSARR